MQRWEYLQLSVNYYSSDAGMVSLANNEDSEVWKGLGDYLDVLNKAGWIMINETDSDRERTRTYHLKKPVD